MKSSSAKGEYTGRWPNQHTYHQRHRSENTARMKKWREKNPEYFRSKAKEWRAANPMDYRLNSIRTRARRKGLEFSITAADLPVPEFCPWLGTKLDWTFNGRRNSPNIPSVDRIDSKRGYVPGNVEIISWLANTIKSNATLDELILMGKRAEKLKQQLASRK